MRLTDEELEKLRERYPAEYQQKIEDLSDYMKRVGKKYADHYLTLLKWLKEDADKTRSPAPSSFETDEFFAAALARSYSGTGCAAEKTKNGNGSTEHDNVA